MPVNGSETDAWAPALVLALELTALLCPSVLSAMGKAVTPPCLEAAASEVDFPCVEMLYLRLVSLCSLGLSCCCPSSCNKAPGSQWCSIRLSGSHSRQLSQRASGDARRGPGLPESIPRTLGTEEARATEHSRRKPCTFFWIYHLWSIGDCGLRISSNVYIFSLYPKSYSSDNKQDWTRINMEFWEP